MSKLETLMILVPALPLAAAALTPILGPRILRQRSHLPAVAGLIGSFICALLLLQEVRQEVKIANLPTAATADAPSVAPPSAGFEHVHVLWTWADVGGAYQPAGPIAQQPPAAGGYAFNIEVALRADPLTSIMLVMVTFISSLVAIYAVGYMHGDDGYWRFFTYVSLFVFSMTMLVSVSNFALLYVFWEAVGACSYLLIGFWYQKPEAAAAGKKAFLVNRVGDFGFALGVFLIWITYGTLDFHDTDGTAGVLGSLRLSGEQAYVAGGVGLAICLLLFVGACGKSAQFPLHVWLPDAMEGPTPVSALIHAATMVTAGVYLVARCSPLFVSTLLAVPEGAPWWHNPSLVVAAIGCFTALLAGLIALTQTDLKRVLAYSTVSQLGFMFLGLGTATLAGITAGMFHLFTHAFFKALLFLGAGSVMHAMGGVIDMRRFSGLRKLMPTTHWTFLFGCLALSGVVPFAGFFSKDAIIAAVYHRALEQHGGLASLYGLMFFTSLAAAGMTAFYTFRAFFLTFYGPEKIPQEAGHHAHESPATMTVPLGILAFFALAVGAVLEKTEAFAHFIHQTPQLAFQALAPAAAHAPHGESHGMSHFTLAALSTVIALGSVGLAAFLYLGDRQEVSRLARLFKPAYALSYGKFFIDQLYQITIVLPLRLLAAICYAFDRYVIDGLVDFCGAIPPFVGRLFRSLQMGFVPFYALAMVLGLLVLIGTLMKWS
ncbi:MAG: NADH-quinone oxidoreductase subunit L [Pirellulales bacterium]